MIKRIYVEASGEDIRKYYSALPEQEYNDILKADPTSIVKDGKVDKVGKYSKKVLDWFKKSKFDLKNLRSDLEKYKNNLSKMKPIEQYRSYDEFIDELKDVGVQTEAKVVFNESGWLVREILTKRAAQYYGCDQGWCTATVGGTYYDTNYSPKHGRLFIIYRDDKIIGQFFISKDKASMEFEAPHKRKIDVDEFISNNPSIEKFFYEVAGMLKFEGFKVLGRKFKYSIEQDAKGEILVFSIIDLSDLVELKSFKQLPWYGKRYKVSGDFNCSYCKSLISLEGSLESVGVNFNCYNCTSLTSLEGSPESVGGNFDCSYCTSLTSLEGSPESVGGNFDCYNCTSLTSLEGSLESVGGNFDCYNCTSLTSLEGSLESVGGNFNCSYCTSLTSLEGSPESVGGNFDCSYCTSLTSLEGSPESVGGNFDCSYCGKKFSVDEVKKYSNVKGKVSV